MLACWYSKRTLLPGDEHPGDQVVPADKVHKVPLPHATLHSLLQAHIAHKGGTKGDAKHLGCCFLILPAEAHLA